MSSSPSNAPAETRSAEDIIRNSQVAQSPNGICYAASGETAMDTADLERLIAAVPRNIAASLDRKAYYFVPLAIGEGESTLVSERYDVALSDRAVCHRNLTLGDSQCVFISTRLMDDKFSVAFEFYINVGHAFVERAGVSQDFADLVWKQVEAGVRGETSLDAYDFRRQALGRRDSSSESDSDKPNSRRSPAIAPTPAIADEKAKSNYLQAAFSDAIAIYVLSLYIDVDYYDLREREYPLLAPPALAERLRKIAGLFPSNPGYEFAVYYRRRS
ncbi:MAG: hypothetical protein JWO13_199 [Acidobacteriales bacterium]|nr:hypothetical protein [Terriglobales bacterium]